MEIDAFTELLQKNNPDDTLEFLLSNGKKPKPVCPVYFLNDVNEELLKKDEEERKLHYEH